MKLRVGVIGSGSFGRAIALAAERNEQDTLLWSRRDLTMPGAIRTTTELADLGDRELIFIAVPAPHLSDLATELGKEVDGTHQIVHVSRGLVGPELKPITAVLAERTACRRLGALAGPLVADALAEGRPGGAIIGTAFPELASLVRTAIGGPVLRIYESEDVVGVQFASATVGLLTVMIGFAQARGTDPGTLAVLATRGMVEVSRIGEGFGAERSTFMGLSGLGDLIAAVAGDERPEFRFGQALEAGATLREAVEQVGAHVEGADVGRHLILHAERFGIETPISSIFAAVLDGEMTTEEAITALMQRPIGKE